MLPFAESSAELDHAPAAVAVLPVERQTAKVSVVLGAMPLLFQLLAPLPLVAKHGLANELQAGGAIARHFSPVLQAWLFTLPKPQLPTTDVENA